MKLSISAIVSSDVKSNRKENVFYKELSAICILQDGSVKTISFRFYATKSKHYCCVFAALGSEWLHTSGSAGGYGYNRESAALYQALSKAGIEISGLNGSGQCEEALKMLADHYYNYSAHHIIIHSAHA
jgi:hypothetical protein